MCSRRFLFIYGKRNHISFYFLYNTWGEKKNLRPGRINEKNEMTERIKSVVAWLSKYKYLAVFLKENKFFFLFVCVCFLCLGFWSVLFFIFYCWAQFLFTYFCLHLNKWILLGHSTEICIHMSSGAQMSFSLEYIVRDDDHFHFL